MRSRKIENHQIKYDMKINIDKAALHGISPPNVTRALQVGLGRSKERGLAPRSPFPPRH